MKKSLRALPVLLSLLSPALAADLGPERGMTVQLDVTQFRAETCDGHPALAVVPGEITSERELFHPPTVAYVYDLRQPERQNPRGPLNAWRFTAQPGALYSTVTLCLTRAGVFELRVYPFTPRADQGAVLRITRADAAPPPAVTYPATLNSALGIAVQ